jgi:hypothetical protein
MSSSKNLISINLNLSNEELLQLYWNAYGTSLVKSNSAPMANEGYLQILEQIEDYLVNQDPDNLFKIEHVKKQISDSILKRKSFN